ncbi:hypothetical protein [Breznakia pachnodae]|uniref:Uncharacterized protein n=1 Tax=Breznakia pachnodae TaxID=265178 RepID=A0ABU0E3M5_9FIRM|nr:hypothetical protein [Breznakia pachnodae]MDQ0361502.1 hypothetical protein [Breznakia pachnodae]
MNTTVTLKQLLLDLSKDCKISKEVQYKILLCVLHNIVNNLSNE